jgi:hypothetical protein
MVWRRPLRTPGYTHEELLSLQSLLARRHRYVFQSLLSLREYAASFQAIGWTQRAPMTTTTTKS